MCQKGMAQQIQVTHGIENFVFDEFVVVAQPVCIENFVIVYHDRVVQAPAHGQTVGAHHLYVFGEAKGTSACDVFGVVTGAEVELHALAGRVHGGVVEINFKTQFEAVVR